MRDVSRTKSEIRDLKRLVVCLLAIAVFSFGIYSALHKTTRYYRIYDRKDLGNLPVCAVVINPSAGETDLRWILLEIQRKEPLKPHENVIFYKDTSNRPDAAVAFYRDGIWYRMKNGKEVGIIDSPFLLARYTTLTPAQLEKTVD